MSGISGAYNKAADCLSHLVELCQATPAQINVLSDKLQWTCLNTRSQTCQCLSVNTSTSQPDIMPEVSEVQDPMPKSLTADRLEVLLQMQETDSFCKRISKCLSNGKAPHHETDLFTHVKGLTYKHVTDSGQKFLVLVIPKSWKYTVLVEVHDKLGHQGNTHTYCLIKCQCYWKDMKKETLPTVPYAAEKKAKVQAYPLQMMEIPDRLFDKIAIDLVTEGKTPNSGNKHILTIIDDLMGWPETFLIPDKSADTIVSSIINQYLPVHMCPRYILPDNGMELKNSLMDQVLKQLGIERIFSAPYHPQGNGKLEVFHKYLKPTPKKLCEKDPIQLG